MSAFDSPSVRLARQMDEHMEATYKVGHRPRALLMGPPRLFGCPTCKKSFLSRHRTTVTCDGCGVTTKGQGFFLLYRATSTEDAVKAKIHWDGRLAKEPELFALFDVGVRILQKQNKMRGLTV